MTKQLIIMSGIPGSGKTYWAKTSNYIKRLRNRGKFEYISRDEIRFSVADELGADLTKDYYQIEKTVYNVYIVEILEALRSDDISCVVVDATHLNYFSRKKLIYELTKDHYGEEDYLQETYDCEIILVHIDTPLVTCIERQEERPGIRAVPTDVIKSMFMSKQLPTKRELKEINYDRIYVVSEGFEVLVYEREEK